MSTSPPRLLAGATLIFWGAQTGHTVAGLITAILLEARSWSNIRWNFKPASYTKAWRLSILCGTLVSILAWMNGVKVGKIHTLFIWAPLIILPLELAQRYGRASQIPLNTFSFFARRQIQHELSHGRTVAPRMINTGYPYIAIVALATAMASRNELHHFIGASLIIGACLFFHIRQSGFRPRAWIAAFLILVTLSFAGQWGIFKLYHHYTGGNSDSGGNHTSANESRTSIGRLGRLKLSPRIFWRMQVTEGNVPRLLRTATYNQYSRARWSHNFIPDNDDERRDEFDYIPEEKWSGDREGERDIRGFTETTPELTKKPPIRIIGEIDTKVLSNPIPLPHFTLAIADLDKAASIECNSLGTVRMFNPDYNIVEYSVWTSNLSTTELPPSTSPNPNQQLDLAIPAQEQDAIHRVAQQLNLHAQTLTTRDKIRILRHFFNTKFKYSTHLDTPRIGRGKRQSAIGTFLETTRSGHCEYFATSTALLLREIGVPTRYCVGFSVNERDTKRDEWVMRGQHAHAWCRAWVDGGWEDIDLTPAAWNDQENNNTHLWQQRLSDWWQRLREDFLIWRTRETNKTKVLILISSILTLLTLWITWRLWQSRLRKTKTPNTPYQRTKPTPLTPLNKIEPLVAKKIGPRPEGTPLSQWIINLASLDPSLAPNLKEAIKLHSIIRFDPLGPRPEQLEQITHLTFTLRKHIKRIKP